MKSSYEIAMERLAKASPAVKLTTDQKKQPISKDLASKHIETIENIITNNVEAVITAMDDAKTFIEIAEKENLMPIPETEVNRLIEKDAYRNGPSIETFWKAKNILE